MKKIISLLIIILLGLFIVISVNNVVSINQLAKDNSELQRNLENLKKENTFLIKEVNELEDPERIIKIAIEKIGMKFPQKLAKKLELE
jgi:cell division protein FtsL